MYLKNTMHHKGNKAQSIDSMICIHIILRHKYLVCGDRRPISGSLEPVLEFKIDGTVMKELWSLLF